MLCRDLVLSRDGKTILFVSLALTWFKSLGLYKLIKGARATLL
jgi:hypothetical protein